MPESSARRVRALYGETLPPAYDDRAAFPLRVLRRARMLVGQSLHDFDAQAMDAIEATPLSRGNRVLVFCCGTGREFVAIRDRIGPEGSIVGVDASPAMLARARRFVEGARWSNVTLLESDVTESPLRDRAPFDVGLCTLGMSIIPEWEAAYRNLLRAVRPEGLVVIGDLQAATGWRGILNPLVTWWTRPYGGSRVGHANMRELFERMERGLEPLDSRTYGHGTYRYCVARKPPG